MRAKMISRYYRFPLALPSLITDLLTKASHARQPLYGRLAEASKLHDLGRLATCVSGTIIYSAIVPEAHDGTAKNTSSPISKLITLCPMSTITPAQSLPKVTGSSFCF